MSDMQPKLSLRTGVNVVEKTPSPPTKLMLNHGKPNFTINRSKSKTDTQCPFSPSKPEAASVVLKSTTNNLSNGYTKPSVLKIPLNGENEVNKVVLRRTKLPEENSKSVPSDEEPEFVKAQRKIAERLANQNNLDFESRKSGYFTHVMMSPTSPTKQMKLPIVAYHNIEKATIVEVVSEVAEPIKTLTIKDKEFNETEEVAVKKDEANILKAKNNIHENGNTTQMEERKPTEVVEAAKAMIEELVQNVAKETEDEVSTTIQNGSHTGTYNGDDDAINYLSENGNTTQSEINFEPKTVTSFAQELSSEPNKYPDTVKVTKEINSSVQDKFVQDMYKMKFDIHCDSNDIKVTPTLKATE